MRRSSAIKFVAPCVHCVSLPSFRFQERKYDRIIEKYYFSTIIKFVQIWYKEIQHWFRAFRVKRILKVSWIKRKTRFNVILLRIERDLNISKIIFRTFRKKIFWVWSTTIFHHMSVENFNYEELIGRCVNYVTSI